MIIKKAERQQSNKVFTSKNESLIFVNKMFPENYI